MILYNATAVMLTTTQRIHRNPKHIASMIWGLKAPSNTMEISAMSWAKSYYPGTITLSITTCLPMPLPTYPPPSSKTTTATVSGPVCGRCLTLLHLTALLKISENNNSFLSHQSQQKHNRFGNKWCLLPNLLYCKLSFQYKCQIFCTVYLIYKLKISRFSHEKRDKCQLQNEYKTLKNKI